MIITVCHSGRFFAIILVLFWGIFFAIANHFCTQILYLTILNRRALFQTTLHLLKNSVAVRS